MNLETFQSKIRNIFLRMDIRIIKSGGNDQKRTKIAIYLQYRSNRYCPIRHQKDHFIELTLTALGAIMDVPKNGLIQDANATTLGPETERMVNNLDEHIAKDRTHEEREQVIKRGLDEAKLSYTWVRQCLR
jgi:hypothetical protein